MRRRSIIMLTSGKSQANLIWLIQSLSYVLKIFATQKINSFNECFDNCITSVAYNTNVKQYDLNSRNMTILDWALLLPVSK